MGSARRPAGFTLLEIIVVLALIGLTLFAILPRMAPAVGSDPGLRAMRRIIHTVAALKREAVVEQEMITLHVDTAANRFIVSRGADAVARADGRQLALDEGVRLVEVVYPGGTRAAAGDARIRFFPQGYSDGAVIRLAAADGRRFSLRVAPFLSGARLLEEGWGGGE